MSTSIISLLRGINVSGQKKIKMAELKSMYESLGCQNVRTYIQSGNVVFEGNETEHSPTVISSAIKSAFGFDVEVIHVLAKEIEEILAFQPWKKSDGSIEDHVYVAFLKEIPAQDRVEILRNAEYGSGEWKLLGKAVFFHCPAGYGKSKLNNNFLESKLKVVATTRNWNTCQLLGSWINA